MIINYIKFSSLESIPFDKAEFILKPKLNRVFVRDEIVGATDEPVLVSEVVFHELGNIGGFVDGQVNKSPVPDEVALGVKNFYGWSFESGNVSALAEVILNSGHMIGQV